MNEASELSSEPTFRIEPWCKHRLTMQGQLKVIVLAGLVLLVLTVWYFLAFLHILPPAYGLRFAQNSSGQWVVVSLNPPASLLEVNLGDQVVEAPGLSPPYTSEQLEHASHLTLRPNEPSNRPATHQVSLAAIETAPNTGRSTQLVLGLLGLVYAGFGLLVYAYAWQRVPARLFFSSCSTLAVAFLVSAIGYNGQFSCFTTVLALSSAMLGFLCLFHFFSVFPHNTRLPMQFFFSWSLKVSYRLFGLLSAGLFLSLVWPDLYSLIRPLINIYLSYLSVIIPALIILKFFKTTALQSKNELRVIGLTLILAFAPFFLLQWLPQAQSESWLPQNLTYLLFLILPIGFAYSIFRYQSLDIRNLLKRDLLRLVLTVVFGSLYVALFLIVRKVVGDSSLFTQLLIIVSFSLLVTFSFNQLQLFLQRIIDRMVFKDFYEYKPALQNLTAALTQQSELEELARVLLSSLVKLFNIELAALTISRRSPGQPTKTYYKKILRQSSSDKPSLLPSQLETIINLKLPQSTRFYLIWYPQVEQPTGLLSLELDQEMTATLTLGTKLNEEPFGLDDVTLVETLAGSMQASLQKVLLIDELEHKVTQLESYSRQLRENTEELSELSQQVLRSSEDERVRLAREIHDGPLQELSLITRQIDPADPALTPHEKMAWQMARQVSMTLRTICTELRPPYLDDIGLVPALESLASQVYKRHSLVVETTLDQDLPRLDPQIELVLYRVAQEALQNVVKHAQADRVCLQLDRQDTTVTLRVRDNGVGFEKPYHASLSLARGQLGLVGIRERVQSIDGVLVLSSVCGEGTLLETSVSL